MSDLQMKYPDLLSSDSSTVHGSTGPYMVSKEFQAELDRIEQLPETKNFRMSQYIQSLLSGEDRNFNDDPEYYRPRILEILNTEYGKQFRLLALAEGWVTVDVFGEAAKIAFDALIKELQ
jgi:hypothetical protein